MTQNHNKDDLEKSHRTLDDLKLKKLKHKYSKNIY